MQLWENTREPTLTCLFILSSWGHNDGEGRTTIIMLFHKSQVILLHLGRSVKTITTATTTKTTIVNHNKQQQKTNYIKQQQMKMNPSIK